MESVAYCLLISIFLLWSFAFVTGLSPSVLRAVTMFSFVALAHDL
jgi:competence protein ComEC